MSRIRVADMTPEQYAQAKARYARYRTTDKYQAVQERFKATKRRSVTSKANRDRVRREHPEVIFAQGQVAAAVRAGLLEKASACESCGKVVRLDGHHHNGYTAPHVLDVIWLCRKCHRSAHP